jgi:ribosomal protein S18 acetylase RimI-like enzyme
MLTISLHSGSRESLAALFSEADDSESEIASYRDLGEVLVANFDGRVIGHVQIVETGDPEVVEIKSLAVMEGRRSQGIGTALVEAALAHCRGGGARCVRVATAAASVDALKFYQRLGFRIQRVVRDFYVPSRGYRPLRLNGIPLLDKVILDIAL